MKNQSKQLTHQIGMISNAVLVAFVIGFGIASLSLKWSDWNLTSHTKEALSILDVSDSVLELRQDYGVYLSAIDKAERIVILPFEMWETRRNSIALEKAGIVASTTVIPSEDVSPSRGIPQQRDPSTSVGMTQEVTQIISQISNYTVQAALTESELVDLISASEALKSMLKGEKGDKGDSGIPVAYTSPTSTNTSSQGSVAGITHLSGQDVSAQTLVVSDSATLKTLTVSGNSTLSSITASGLLSFTGTDHAGIRLNNLTTVQRDALTPLAGMTVFNTTASKMQVYNGTTWKNVGNPEIGGEVTSGTSGSVLFVDASGNLAQDNVNFNFNDTSNTLTVANIVNPLLIGGTGVGSTLTLKSTSGVGSSDAIIFQVGNNGATEAMRINTSGNIGIGTATISAKLHSLAATEQLRLGYDASNYNSFTVGSTGSLTIAATGTNPNITLTPGGTGYTILNGNVGIGTTGPVNKLQVVGTNAAAATSGTAENGSIRISASGTLAMLDIGASGSPAHAWLQVRDAGNYATNYNLALQPNGGSVGIGTTAPATKLDVRVSDATNNGNTDLLTIAHNTSGTVGAQSAFEADTGNTLGTSLIAYYKLDELDYTRTDAAGSNNLTDNNTVFSAAGKKGSAGRFVAANSEYLSIADNTDMSTGNINFSVSAWVYLDTKTGHRGIVSKLGSAIADREYQLYYDNGTDRFNFEIVDASNNFRGVLANNLGSPSTGTWYHIVAWHDAAADTVNIKVNNGATNSASTSGSAPNDGAAAFTIGRVGTGENLYMDGRIDEVGFWKKILTAQEITDLYNSANANTCIDDCNGPGPTNIASGLMFKIQDTAGDTEDSSRISSILTNATSGSESSALAFSTRNSGGSLTERMRITSSGFIGIGTTNPDRRFVLDTSDSTNVASMKIVGKWAGTDDAAALVIDNVGTSENRGARIEFYSSVIPGFERWSIGAGGDGGYTNSPTTDDFFIYNATDDFTALTITGEGNVSIGTGQPDSGVRMDISGDVEVGTGTTGCVRDEDNTVIAGTCSSDKRLKTNIQPLGSVLDKVSLLNPVTFDWIDDSNLTPNYGFIAQEVEEILPELVQEGEDGYKRVSYDTSLTTIMFKAIQELNDKLSVIQNGNGEIVVNSDYSQTGITNVKLITSASGMWSIDENGILIVKEVRTDKLCIGTTCVDEAMLKSLLEQNGLSGSQGQVAGENTEVTNDNNDNNDTTESAPEESIIEEPAPESEPAPETQPETP